MENKFLLFLKKTYLIFVIILAAVIFFLGYNVYLVDHSLVNLKLALDKVSDARTLEDVKKVEQALSYPLRKELSKGKLDMATLADLEYINDVVANPQSLNQVEDVKFFLKRVIAKKSQERGPLMASLDSVTKAVLPIQQKESINNLKKEERNLKEKINTTTKSEELQELYSQLNVVYQRLSDYKKAEEVSTKIIELDPKSYRAAKTKFTKAWDYKQKGSFEMAKKAFDEIINEFPNSEIAVLSKYEAADILYKEGKVEDSIKANEEFSSEYTGSPVAQLAQFKVGATYLYDLNNFDAAVKAFDKIGETWKEQPLIKYIDNKVVPFISKKYRSRGYYLLSRKRYDAAKDSFSNAIKVNEKDSQSYTGIGVAFWGLGEKEKALERAREAVTLNSRDWVAAANLGYIYLQLEMYDSAVDQSRRAITLNPKIAEIYYNLGYAYARQENFAKGVSEFQKAVALKPNFAYAYNNLGYCFWYENRFGEALEALNKATQLNPEYADAQYNIGIIYESQALYENAIRAYENTLRINPHYPRVKERLQKLRAIQVTSN
ncbi:MAG: tetratricopeptide repeat protein [Candidatus Omnitrophica bacterium]|nr:tetratricopeptide repeat protein [Candidatus Omnitrophota bacterium]